MQADRSLGVKINKVDKKGNGTVTVFLKFYHLMKWSRTEYQIRQWAPIRNPLSPMFIGYLRLLELTYDMAKRLEVSTQSLHKNRLNALNGMN